MRNTKKTANCTIPEEDALIKYMYALSECRSRHEVDDKKNKNSKIDGE